MAHLERVVVLVDMDCFYCQVEEKLDPKLAGKAIAVVQYNAWKGGGIIAVNYPARDRGVTRHMRGNEAKEKCPEIVLARVPNVRGKADLTKYREAGKRVAEVLQTFTPLLERASVDEAYLDITEAVCQRIEGNHEDLTLDQLKNTHVVGCDTADFLYNIYESGLSQDHNLKLAVGGAITEEIRAAVYERTGYRCSAGIAHNKILAKLGAGLHKPNQQTIMPQEGIEELYKDLPVRKIRSLGGKFGHTLSEDLGIKFMGELIKFSEKQLAKKFDEKTANWLYNIARGIDNEPVTLKMISKSIGCCKKFPGRTALCDLDSVIHWLKELSEEIAERLEQDMEENNRRAKQVIVSFAQDVNRKEVHSSRTTILHSYDSKRIQQDSFEVLKKFCMRPDGTFRIKFLGLSVGKFEDCKNLCDIASFFKSSTSNATTGNANTGNMSTGNTSTGNTSTGITSTGNTSTGNVNSGNTMNFNKGNKPKGIASFFLRAKDMNLKKNNIGEMEVDKLDQKEDLMTIREDNSSRQRENIFSHQRENISSHQRDDLTNEHDISHINQDDNPSDNEDNDSVYSAETNSVDESYYEQFDCKHYEDVFDLVTGLKLDDNAEIKLDDNADLKLDDNAELKLDDRAEGVSSISPQTIPLDEDSISNEISGSIANMDDSSSKSPVVSSFFMNYLERVKVERESAVSRQFNTSKNLIEVDGSDSEGDRNEEGRNEEGRNEEGKNEEGRNEGSRNEDGRNENGTNENGIIEDDIKLDDNDLSEDEHPLNRLHEALQEINEDGYGHTHMEVEEESNGFINHPSTSSNNPYAEYQNTSYFGEDTKETCKECQKKVLKSEMVSHLDYHFVLKMVREESAMYKQNPRLNHTNSESGKSKEGKSKEGKPKEGKSSASKSFKTPAKKSNKRKSNDITKSTPKLTAFLSSTQKLSEDEVTEICSECNKNIPVDDFLSHLDYHAAKKLHLEINPGQGKKAPYVNSKSDSFKMDVATKKDVTTKKDVNSKNSKKKAESGHGKTPNRSVMSFFKPV